MNSNISTIESTESSSPIVTRAVAASLKGEDFDTYNFSPLQRAALGFVGWLPQEVGRFAISRFEALSGLDPKRLAGFRIEHVLHERLQDYRGLEQKYPCITLGAALGGATSILALAANGPFLPQAFVATLKGGAFDGDVQTYFQHSAQLAQEIAQKNPEILTIQHYDPVHDEWMTRFVNHIRFKLLDLPMAYRDFIHTHLQPGGSILYLDSRASWLRYRTGERSVFQVGGWGDLSPEEYLNGSDRLTDYCRTVGLKQTFWRLSGYPLERGAESEWGSEPGLGEALENFCQQEGYQFVQISLPHPQDYALLAFEAIMNLIERDGKKPAGTLIEMFTQFSPIAVFQASLLPVWLIFNTLDSLAFLRKIRPAFPEGKPVFFSPLSTFTHTPDLVPWQEWESALAGLDWVNIGTRPSHYPADPWALTGWSKPLKKWVRQNYQPIRNRLAAVELADLALNIAHPQ